MTMSADNTLALRQLIVQLREGQLTPHEQTQLKQLLVASQDARRLYARYTAMLALLELEVPSLEPEDSFAVPGGPTQFEPVGQDASASVTPVLGFLGNAMHATAGFFTQTATISYIIATLIVAVGLLVGWVVPLSHPEYAANQPQGSTPPSADWRSMFVGRITGMVECRWADAATMPVGPVAVPLGRKYALASGLLEITYDTGAKVILQGPCAYEVDSAAGGYLSAGRLVARVEKKGSGVGAQGSESSNRKSQIVNSSQLSTLDTRLFTVTTPTATVTDLGTEFGVEVDETGNTETHVFQGCVKLTGHGQTGNTIEQVLIAGQAAKVDAASAMAVQYGQGRFVRKIPAHETPNSRELLGQIDYSDTWTANSTTRPGSYLLLKDPESLRVEHCYGNPPRSWTFSVLSAMTTWPFDAIPMPWPGCRVRGSESGFMESGVQGGCYLGFEYGLREDFVVQFDAVQTSDRINITIGDAPATIDGDRSLSVFFRAPGTKYPEIGVYTPSKLEADAGIHSNIAAPFEWHNYAVRFNLREKRLTLWVDREYVGAIELANIRHGMENDPGHTWANLSLSAQYVTIGGYSVDITGRVWIDNFRVGAPNGREMNATDTGERQAGNPIN